MAKTRHAEIAGGGLAGLATAIALRQRGWSVRVHERDEEPRIAGSGLSIFENGLKVFEALGVYERAVAGARRGRYRETRDAKGRTTARASYQTRMFEISRRQVVAALLAGAQGAGVDIVTGSKAVAAEPEGVLVTADGGRHPADLVVAADGVNSRLTDGLGLAVRRTPLGDGAIRIVVARTAAERAGKDAEANIEYWSGRRRILIAPCSDEELYIALTAPVIDNAGTRLPIDKTSWRASFPTLGDLIDRLDGDTRWDRFVVIKLQRWSSGRVAVVGDAAHAMAPNLGQGGACAMMNGLALATYLERSVDVETALAEWERRERPLTDHTQRLSTFYSRLTFWPDLCRSAVFWMVARTPALRRQYWRCANHVPTGGL